MKRRSGAGRQPPRPYKAASPKRRNAKNVTRKRGASIAGQETVVARITRERDEALLRETANSEILRLISRSPGELEPVFNTMLANAIRICQAKFGGLFLFEDHVFRSAAQQGMPYKHQESWREQPLIDLRNSHPGLPLSRVGATKDVIQIADVAAEAGILKKMAGLSLS